MIKNLPAVQETRIQSLGQEDPWRREWQLTPVFLPGWATAHGSQTAGHDYTQSTVYVALGHVSDMGML